MDRITTLRAFVRLVEVGTFTVVANELRVKQSTVSKWLAALEEEYDVCLINRTTRSQRITDAGKTLYDHARTILAAYDAMTQAMSQGEVEPRGRIRISLPVTFGRLFIVPHIATFLNRYPATQVDMVLGDRYVSVVEEGFDLAIRVGVPVDSGLRNFTLGNSPRCLVASPSYLKTHGTPKTPKSLEKHECLVHAQPGTATIWRLTKSGKTERCTIRGRVSANNSEATLALAREGLGVCLLASWLVDEDIRSGRLVELLTQYELPSAPVRALAPPGSHTPNHVRRLIEHLRAELSTLPPAPV